MPQKPKEIGWSQGLDRQSGMGNLPKKSEIARFSTETSFGAARVVVKRRQALIPAGWPSGLWPRTGKGRAMPRGSNGSSAATAVRRQ